MRWLRLLKRRSRFDSRTIGSTDAGKTTKAISASVQSFKNATTMSATSEVASRITEATASVSAVRTSATSLVTRDRMSPVGVRLKNASDRRWMCSFSSSRRSPMMRWPTRSMR